jgi:ligand-binding sensor domain-containing protein/serine phosphatase RsbU (regulator of sigma subunit)
VLNFQELNFALRMRKGVLHILFFFFCAFAWRNAAAQSKVKFEPVPADQGLSNKCIPAILQDKQGFLWFATQDGLNKYDGYHFKVFQNDPSDSNTLSKNNIFSLIQDKEGFLWLGTENGGLNKFDPLTEKVTRFAHRENDPSSISSNNVYCIAESRSGSEFWIGTWDAGLDIMDKKTGRVTRHFHHDPGDTGSISSGGIWDIHEDGKGALWIATWGGGLDKLDLSTGKCRHFRPHANDPSSISYDIVGPIYEDKEGIFWIATWGGGLNRFDPATEKFTRYMYDPADPGSIGSNRTWPIVEDKQGNLWIGTYGSGVNKFDRKTGKFTRYAHDAKDPNSLNYNDVWSLFIDRSGIMWVGTEGGGISKFVNIKKKVDFYTLRPGDPLSLGHNSVRTICEDHDHVLWIGSWDGGLDKFDPASGTITNYRRDLKDASNTGLNKIKVICEDTHGTLWMGAYRGGLCSFDREKGTFSYRLHDSADAGSVSDNYVQSIAEDKKGNLWVGTVNGLNIYDRKTGKFKRFMNKAGDAGSISNNTVNCIYVTGKGDLWVATDIGLNRFSYSTGTFTRFLHNRSDSSSLAHNTVYTLFEDDGGTLWAGTRNGLDQFIPATGTFRHYTTVNGLPDNMIVSMEESGSGILLIGTNKGISRFEKSTGTFVNYNTGDGITGLQFFPNASCRTHDGKMYFGCTEGLNSFFPDSIESNPWIPPVLITAVKCAGTELKFGVPVAEAGDLVLAYNQNSIAFDFVALSYASPEENQYMCRMEGLDDAWHYCGSQRYASFSNLPPGDYVFHVRASNDDGLWNKFGASFHVIIQPPFWKTAWFYTLCTFGVIVLVVVYVKARERKLRREKKILEHKVEERTAEVIQQKIIVEHQHKEIKDSILYAKRIQQAILPVPEELSRSLADFFILFKPRDIVSGDFYWFSEKNGKVVIAAADCTGHGVPGALMSMIGNTLLNEIVNEKEVLRPDLILGQLRENIIKTLKQTGAEGENKDGMDIALCVLDRPGMLLEFAGANNPLYLVSGSELTEVKGDKQPIGVYQGETKPFTNHRLEIKKGDRIYLASDGYADQFGGPSGKKFKYRQMKELILSLRSLPMKEQKEALDRAIESWRGGLDQIDDILVIGIGI